MEQLNDKFKLIFLPFLYIMFAVIGGYTFLHWLFFIKYNPYKVDEGIVNFIVPFILPLIPLLIWLRPRIKLLKLKVEGRKDPVALYLMLAWIIIAIPTTIAQSYVETATGKLTQLDNLGEINNLPTTKYYTVKHYYVNKNFVHVKITFGVSGKHDEDFNITIYVLVPVFNHLFPDTTIITNIIKNANINTLVFINGKVTTVQQLKKLPADSIRLMRYLTPLMVAPRLGDAGKYGAIVVVTKRHKLKVEPTPMKIAPAAWLALEYDKRISNNLSYTEKNIEYRTFLALSNMDFKRKPLDKFIYLSRPPYNSGLKNYVAAIKSKGDVVDGEPLIFLPVYQPFAMRNGNKQEWILISLAAGLIIFMLSLLLAPFRPGVVDNNFVD